MDLSTEHLTIYIPLLNEGTDVLRPTKGEFLHDRTYRVLPVPGYNPANEEWMFPPESLVLCELELHDGENIWVARKLADAKNKMEAGDG